MNTKGLSFLLIFGTHFRFRLIAKKPIFRLQIGWVILVIELANTEARMINMNDLLDKMEKVLNVPDIDLQKTAQESLPDNWKVYKPFDIPITEDWKLINHRSV
jgi:hypothetical protein